MELTIVFFIVMALACPIGMGLMMWMMSKQMSESTVDPMHSEAASTDAASRLQMLRVQREAVEAEIAELTQLMELEAQRDALLAGQEDVPVR